MKAVEVLVAARKRLSDIKNWTTGNLCRPCGTAKDGYSFCSIGATLKEGGAISQDMQFVTNILFGSELVRNKKYLTMLRLHIYCENRYHTSIAMNAALNIKAALREKGWVNVAPTIRALSYLQAASRQIKGISESERAKGYVISINDDGFDCDVDVHERVLRMFDLAIKNAKRRHIAGKTIAYRKSAKRDAHKSGAS